MALNRWPPLCCTVVHSYTVTIPFVLSPWAGNASYANVLQMHASIRHFYLHPTPDLSSLQSVKMLRRCSGSVTGDFKNKVVHFHKDVWFMQTIITRVKWHSVLIYLLEYCVILSNTNNSLVCFPDKPWLSVFGYSVVTLPTIYTLREWTDNSGKIMTRGVIWSLYLFVFSLKAGGKVVMFG